MAIDLNELATAIGQLTLRFRLRRRTAALWTSTNEVLLDSEAGYETDTGKMKVGDGTTAWTSLPYFPQAVLSIVAGSGVSVDSADPLHPVVSATGGGGGGGTSYPPDVPPTSPTVWDDEFDYGSGIDTTGARRSGANPWTVHSVSGTTGVDSVQAGLLQSVFPASSGTRLILQPVPSGDFEFTIKAHISGLVTQGTQCLCLYDSSTGHIAFIQFYMSPTLIFQKGTINTSTYGYTFSTNAYTSSIRNPSNWGYLKLAVTNSGTPTVHASVSETGYSFDFTEFYSESLATWVANPTHIGFFENAPTAGLIEFFRRTA